MNKTKDQRPQECKYCVNNHCQHPYYNDCDCVLWRCNLFTPKTKTITQKEIEKAAENYAQKEVNKYDRDIIGLFKNDLKSECQNAFFAGVNFALSKQENDADPVIQGWAARDEDGALCIYEYKPKRVYDTWAHENVWIGEILLRNVHTKPFFNLAWEDEPQEVEITIKRKKK